MAATISKPNVDIDIEDEKDVQAVSEYTEEIFNSLLVKEKLYRPNPNYMDLQTDIDARMRVILIDWLYAVVLKFKLLPESYQLSVLLIDRFLSSYLITRDKLQLLGATCLFTAAKLEEIYPPEVNDFVYMTAQAYTREEIIEMEKVLLDGLGFIIKTPLPIDFQRRFSKAAGLDYTQHTMCKFLIDLCLLSVAVLRLLPSQLSAGATYLARLVTKVPGELWTDDLVYYTHYSEEQVRSYALDIQRILLILQQSPNSTSVIGHYSSRRSGEVAKLNYAAPIPEATNLTTYLAPPVQEPPINLILRRRGKPVPVPVSAEMRELEEELAQLRFPTQLKPIIPLPTYEESEWD